MMIHGVKLKECSELGVKMTFPDNSYCTLAIDVVYRHPRRPPLELGEENIPTDTDRYARRLRDDKTPEDKEIDEAALKLLYSRLARAYLNGELDIKPSEQEEHILRPCSTIQINAY